MFVSHHPTQDGDNVKLDTYAEATVVFPMHSTLASPTMLSIPTFQTCTRNYAWSSLTQPPLQKTLNINIRAYTTVLSAAGLSLSHVITFNIPSFKTYRSRSVRTKSTTRSCRDNVKHRYPSQHNCCVRTPPSTIIEDDVKYRFVPLTAIDLCSTPSKSLIPTTLATKTS